MTLRDELARLRAAMNAERDAREARGADGGPPMPDRAAGGYRPPNLTKRPADPALGRIVAEQIGAEASARWRGGRGAGGGR